MTKYEYGNVDAKTVLIQMVDDHDLAEIETEFNEIKKRVKADFLLVAVKVDDWNKDLSPWPAPAVFGNEAFGNGAESTLSHVLELCRDKSRQYCIGGYSLAGLFALWAAYQTDVFSGAAAASPSAWFPGFTQYMSEHDIKCGAVYLSLGNREAKTRNAVMAQVADRITQCQEILIDKGIPCTLEWNEGNHFKEPGLRTAKAFAWVMDKIK
jgi:hypothetical protein